MDRHPRTQQVSVARLEFERNAVKFMAEHRLTYVEMMQALAGAQERVALLALRHERHPGDHEKGADEA